MTNNLLRNGFTVTAVTDIKTELCAGYPDSIKVDKAMLDICMIVRLSQVVSTPKEVAEISDVIVTGRIIL